jgi:hypothetical protein
MRNNSNKGGLQFRSARLILRHRAKKERAMKTARPEDKALNANEQNTPPENGKGAANPGAVASAPAAAPATDRSAIPTPAGQTATFRYVDRPELVETFADSITGMFFDGQSLRIEFAVSRVDEIKANTPITGRRYPACRLVLPPVAAMELINRMQQIGAAMAKAGLLKSPEAPKP